MINAKKYSFIYVFFSVCHAKTMSWNKNTDFDENLQFNLIKIWVIIHHTIPSIYYLIVLYEVSSRIPQMSLPVG